MADPLETPTFDPVSPEGRRVRVALWIASLLCLEGLLIAIVQEHVLQPWRRHQRAYAALQVQAGKSPRPVQLQQIYVAEHRVTDRCTSCHVGIDDPDMADQPHPYRAHPPGILEIHPPAKFGCTACHGGQGRATDMTAHGDAHGEDPLIPRPYYEAGCGSCHTHIQVAGTPAVERGRRLFEQYDCYACHRLEGKGRGSGPDLSTAGARHIRGWHEKHLALQKDAPEPIWASAYGPIPAEEVALIEGFLRTQVGAPRLIFGKSVAFSKGCLGCHRINGVGGDDGPDLSEAGLKRRLDFGAGRGPKTLANWHREHLLDPGRVVPGSRMPRPPLEADELEGLVLYLLSLRGRQTPAHRWPRDRTLAQVLGEREFGTDGGSLFTAFCAACHGADGLGHRFPGEATYYPAVRGSDLLAVASPAYLRQWLTEGNAAARMPAWGKKDGGLRLAEIHTLGEWLQAAEPAGPSPAEVASARPNPELGERLFRADCAACHGDDGQGTGSGPGAPALKDPLFLRTASDAYLVQVLRLGRTDTAMGRFRHYTAEEVRSLIAYLRAGVELDALPTPPALPVGEASRGPAVYARSCASCHGSAGQGAEAVALVTPGLMEAADEAFLAAAVLQGRCQPKLDSTLSRPRVTPRELADVLAWLRRQTALGRRNLPGRLMRGDPARGQRQWAETCAGCHGTSGQGGPAPALAKPVLQHAATDGFLIATILRGRGRTGMPAFGRDGPGHRRLGLEEARDLVAYVRTLSIPSPSGAASQPGAGGAASGPARVETAGATATRPRGPDINRGVQP